jgi:putrescine aminotransferase
MNKTPKKIKKEAIGDFKKYINLTQAVFLNTVGLDLLEMRKSNVYLWDDAENERFIDCFCSAGSFNVGRLNEEIVGALDRALDEYDEGNYLIPTRAKAALAQKLVEVAPAGLNHAMLTSGGGEANDTALKMARGTTGRPGILAMIKAYHGHTGFSLSAIGKPVYREPFEPLMPEFTHVTFNDLAAVDRAANDKTAAIFLEPVQGEAGIFPATDEFMRGLRRICDERGILLVADEIQTGFGRTGKMFCCQHSGVTPDILTVAKSLSGGIYPISAVLYNDRVSAFVEQHPDKFVSTSGGSDLGCIVGCAAIDYLVKNKIPEHTAEMGDYIGGAIENLAKKHSDLVHEVRRSGLMIGLEYTHDMMGPLMSMFLRLNGVVAIFSGNNPKVMRLMPPIVINREQADALVAALDRSMVSAKRAARIVEAMSKIPLVDKAIGVQELQVVLILIAKTARRLIPWGKR